MIAVSFQPGTTVVLREVLEGRIRSARPLRVIEDGPDRFVGYLVPRSTVAWPRLADEVTQSQTPDQGWRLPLERWQGPGSLFVVPRGAGFAAVLFVDPADGTPLGWKVDFFRPLERHAVGLDTLDQAFDLLAAADCSSWQTKDLDDLAQLVRLGLLAGAERDAFEADRRRVEAWLGSAQRGEGDRGPFGEGWTAWRAAPEWPPLELPPGWDVVAPRAQPDGATSPSALTLSGPGWRSASGIRVLDGDGRIHLDIDLHGGALWLGHAPATLVEALSRQAPLGWQLGPDHPALDALARRIEAVLPHGWSWWWTPNACGADLDLALGAQGWPFALDAACLAAGAELGSFGPRLFAGFPARLAVGPRTAHGLAAGASAAPPPDVFTALAALETLTLARPDVVAAAAERAARLRARHRLSGHGTALVGPPGWRAEGVIVPRDGRALVALCVDDALEAALDERLCEWRAP